VQVSSGTAEQGRGTYAAPATAVLAAPARLGGTRLVCVDGPAGDGQDDVRPAAGRGPRRPTGAHGRPLRRVDAGRCRRPAGRRGPPSAAVRAAGSRRYDWHAGAFAPEPTGVPAAAALVVEAVPVPRRPWTPSPPCGCGSRPRPPCDWAGASPVTARPCARSGRAGRSGRPPSSAPNGRRVRRPEDRRRTRRPRRARRSQPPPLTSTGVGVTRLEHRGRTMEG
jgi:hypothetical protein